MEKSAFLDKYCCAVEVQRHAGFSTLLHLIASLHFPNCSTNLRRAFQLHTLLSLVNFFQWFLRCCRAYNNLLQENTPVSRRQTCQEKELLCVLGRVRTLSNKLCICLSLIA